MFSYRSEDAMVITKYMLIYHLDTNKNLLINTLSGAMDIVDDNTCSLLEDKIIPENNEIVELLKDRGYIFHSKEQESECFKKNENLYNHYSKLSNNYSKLNFLICPTYSCNLRCSYCFQDHDNMHKDNKTMTYEQVDQAFYALENNILKYAGKDSYTITLFGGEPLQAHTKEIVEYILQTAKTKKCKVSIITNGVNIHKFWDIINIHKDMLSFQVTLDGIGEIHDRRRIFANGKGSFNLITSNLDLLIKNNFKVRVRVNLDHSNINSLSNLLEYFNNKTWFNYPKFNVHVSPVNSHGKDISSCSSENEYEIFKQLKSAFPNLKLLKEKYKTEIGSDMFRVIKHINNTINKSSCSQCPTGSFCEAVGLGSIGVGCDGYIYACGESIGNQEDAIGRYYPDYEIFEDKANCWKDRTIFKIKECSQCNLSTFCGGGCPYSALKNNGRVDTGFCGETKNILDKYVYDNKEKFLKMAGD
jgi:uncharacterized protein